MVKIDLNAPGIGPNAQKVADTDVEEPKVPIESKPELEPETEAASEEESKVPYSRFKKFHNAAKEAEREAEYWRSEAERLRERPAPTASYQDGEMPASWVKLYGDSDQSKQAWQVQQQINADIREQTRREALEAVRNERQEEVTRTEQNLEVLDDNFDDLSAMLGRRVTEVEESALLDIVDEYTPKNRDGSYAGDILSFDKAWEIYELKNGASRAGRNASRDNAAAVIGNQSQGQASGNQAEADKNWNPLDWNAWKKRV